MNDLLERPRSTYILSTSNHQGVKLGATHSPETRLRALRTQLDRACHAYGCEPYQDAHFARVYEQGFSLESFLHICLDDRRIHGEWFDIEPDEVDAIVAAYQPAHEAFTELGVDKKLTFALRRSLRAA